MTTKEFSNEFDILYNNIMSNQSPGLDEYEKSVFLTKALDEIVKNYFNPMGNKYNKGFDGGTKRLYDFSSHVVTKTLDKITLDDIDLMGGYTPFFPDGKIFKSPSDVFLILNERLVENVLGNDYTYSIIPITYYEYSRLASKPYPYPLKRQAWRFINDSSRDCSNCSLISLTHTDKKISKPMFVNNSKKLITVNIHIVEENSPNYLIDGKVDTLVLNDKIELTFYVGKGNSYNFWRKWLISSSNLLVVEGKNISSVLLVNMNGNIEYPSFDGWPNDTTNPLNTGSYTFTVYPKGATLNLYEVCGRFTGELTYIIRYVKKLSPIILADLSDTDFSIKGKNTITECTLPEELHSEILQRAVELAKGVFLGDLNSNIELGKRSE